MSNESIADHSTGKQAFHSKRTEILLERLKSETGISGFASTINQNNTLAKSDYQRQEKPSIAIPTSWRNVPNQYISQTPTQRFPSNSLQIPGTSSTASAAHRRSRSQGVSATTSTDFLLRPDTLNRRNSHLGSTTPQNNSSARSDSQGKAPQFNRSDPSIQRLKFCYPTWHSRKAADDFNAALEAKRLNATSTVSIDETTSLSGIGAQINKKGVHIK
jgi:hypothetical protein